MTIFQMGSQSDGVSALEYLKAIQVKHFDKGGQGIARIKRIMKVIKHLAELRRVWASQKAYNF
jgi:hypothetical protein